MRTHIRAILVAILLVGLGLCAARAEEEDTLEARLYRVGALTAGSPGFLPHAFPIVSPDLVSDEEDPLFGAESDDRRLPVGALEDLVNLLQAAVRPAFWEEVDDASIDEIHEQGLLLVHATPAVHAELGRYLAVLERRFLTPLAIDVQAVRTRAAAPPGRLVLTDEEVAGLLSGAAAGPTVRFTALPGQRGFAFDGVETAYLQDGDVEVSQAAEILDPIVGVMSVGLGAAVSAVPSEDRRAVSLSVALLLSESSGPRGQTDKRGWRYDLAAVHATEVRTTVTVPSGAWALLDGQGAAGDPSGWRFLVRAAPVPSRGTTHDAGLLLPRVPSAASRAQQAFRLFEVEDLITPQDHRVGLSTDLMPSNFTPPEPPGLPDPGPVLSDDALIQILWETVAPATWEHDEADLQIWQERYVAACNTPDLLDAVAGRIGLLRHALLGSLVTTAEVVVVPAGLADALAVGAADVLPAEAARSLDAALASGEAQRIDGARVTSGDGIRNHVRSGFTSSYLQDYEVEISERCAIPNPVIHTAFSGLLLDVAATRTSDLAGAHVTLRLDRSRLEEPMRVIDTPHGGLDLPTLQLLRVRSGFTLPLGRRAVVAAAGDGERRTLVLLTIHWVPAKRR